VEHFLATFCHRRCGCIWGVTPEAMEVLVAWDWPGNVRELRNAVEHAIATGSGGLIRPADLPAPLGKRSGAVVPEGTQSGVPTLAEAEGHLVRLALAQAHGNRVRAARALGISRHKLYDCLKRLGIA
jgi:DNA-binding NtrC family response regulator